jgi:pimeloyl-ACP methyl ester carboxylesterase
MRRILVIGTAFIAVLLGFSPVARATAGPQWTTCPDAEPDGTRAQCATIQVPLDWSRPDSKRITLQLSRMPAARPSERVGALLFNPGGPGGAGAETVSQEGTEFFSQTLRDRFDIVGFDPRGTGLSTSVQCTGAPLVSSAPIFPRNAAEFDAMRKQSAKYGASCAKHTEPGLLQHVDTISAAKDIDAIRAALGEQKINFLGLSYGTYLGQTYARLFPNRLRTMVLDGDMDHATGPTAFLVEESAALEDVFRRFAKWCESTTTCPMYGQNVIKVWDQLLANAAKKPIPTSQKGVTLNAGAVELVLPETLYFGPTSLFGDAYWNAIAAGISAASKGDASQLAAMTPVGQPQPAYTAVGCQDFPAQFHGYVDAAARLRIADAVSPHTHAASEAWMIAASCADWPVKSADPWAYQPITNAPPILLVSSLHDPSTPLVWAQGLHRAIRGSKLLTANTVGHTGYLNSECARDREADYLISAKLPTGTC